MRTRPILVLTLAALTASLSSLAQPGGDGLKAATVGSPGSQMPASPTPAVTAEPVTPPLFSPPLAQAVAAYRANPQSQTFGEVLRVLKAILVSGPGQHASSQAIVKANPALAELGPKVVDAVEGRIWTFNKVTHDNEALVQWFEVKSQTVRVRRKMVTTHSVTTHFEGLRLPSGVILREARVIGSPKQLILSGERQGALFLRSYTLQEGGGWREEEGRFATIPSFLTDNVSGKVTFKGADLVFVVARMPQKQTPGAPNLPEADSSTYKFWLHYVDGKYAVYARVPSEEQYAVVYSFLQAMQNGQLELAKNFLADPKLASLPKYVGLTRPPSQTYKVVEMAVPPAGLHRYRLVTFGKNDVIFDVGSVRGRTVIKSIFFAPADSYLREMKQYLANYDKIAAPVAPASDKEADHAK
ncbi:MAG: hypothetical protein U0105_14245 [Candidatus Obscuribacterales bacterium]